MNKYSHKADSCVATSTGVLLTVGQVNFDIAILEENVVRVVQYTDTPTNSYNLAYKDNAMPVEGVSRLATDNYSCPQFGVSYDNNKVILSTDTFSVSIDTDTMHISYSNSSGNVVLSDRSTQSYNLYGELGDNLCHYTSRASSDVCFGLADKTGNINRSGGSWEFCNIDAMGYDANTSDPLYKHVPFYICNNTAGNYGIFYDTHATSWLSLGREKDNYHGLYNKFATEDNSLCYYVMFGSNTKILQTFSQLVGRTAFLPKWSLCYSGSSMSYTDHPEADKQLRHFIELCRNYDIDCRSFHMSSGYSTVGDKRCVFCWDYDKIPQPQQLGKYFVDNGVQIIANIKPAMLLDHPMYGELADKGYFIKYSDGSAAVSQFWDGLGSYIDFTNIDAYNFWIDQVRTKLIANNIFNTWNDNNEYEIWDKQCYCHNFGQQLPAYLIKPAFAVLMVMASSTAQKQSNMRPMLSCRSGSIGIVRYSHTWTGDNNTDFGTLRGNHKMGISQSLSGIYNFGHDVGGFSGDRPDPELFVRWIQHGIFMPRFVIHSWNDDGSTTELWMYSDKLPAIGNLLCTRHMLTPYLYNAYYNAHINYLPIISPLFMMFDDVFDTESDSYMLGNNVLVHNVFDRGVDSIDVYLPENNCGWYKCTRCSEAEGSSIYASHLEGGVSYQLPYALDDEAMFFVRSGCVLPIDSAPYGFGKVSENITIAIFAIDEGQFTDSYFNDDGVSYDYLEGKCTNMQFTVVCTAETVTVTTTNSGSIKANIQYKLYDKLGRQLIVGE